MGARKEQQHVFTSILLCICAVILGTLLYPLILLFFSLIALAHPVIRRIAPHKPSSSHRAPPAGSGA